jgi:hypothetical protein
MNGTLERRVWRCAVLLLALTIVGGAFLSAAPAPQETAGQTEAAAGSSSQQQLITFLAAHPDRLQELAKQPRLLRDKGYLRQHPEVAAFLKDYPEIAQQPAFTEGLPVPSPMLTTVANGNWRDAVAGPCGPALKVQALEYELDNARNSPFTRRGSSFGRIMDFAGPFVVFVVILSALLQTLKLILENRRWSKVAKVQSEAHAKLLEKFGTSQELLAYMGTDAGKRFLESQPLEVESRGARVTPYPFRRILASIQLGVVVLLLGLGLLFLRGHVGEDAEVCLVLGTVASTVGIGFLLSAAASYGLSQHLGLLEGVTSKRP